MRPEVIDWALRNGFEFSGARWKGPYVNPHKPQRTIWKTLEEAYPTMEKAHKAATPSVDEVIARARKEMARLDPDKPDLIYDHYDYSSVERLRPEEWFRTTRFLAQKILDSEG